MRTLLFYLLLIFSATSFAQLWGHRYSAEQTNQNISVDVSESFTVSVEWNQGDWTASDFGYGYSTDGTNWVWTNCPWFQNGSENNKRCKTSVSISIPGKYYYAYRFIKNSTTTYQHGDDNWSQNSTSISATSTIIVGEVSKVSGSWNSTGTWEDGTIPSSSDNVAIMYDVNVSSSSQVANSVYIYDDKTLTIQNTGDLTISNGLTISSGSKGAGTLTINSDASGTGSLITNGDITGVITVQRYLAQNIFHYITSPINYTSGTFNDLSMGLTAGSGEDDFRRYETSTNTWIDILNGSGGSGTLMDDETFVQGQGYAIAYKGENKTLSLSGTPNNGDINVAVSSGGVGDNAGANFVGNPYPSTLKVSGFLAANNSTNGTINTTISGTLYFWDEPGSGGFEKGDYATRTSSTGVAGGGGNTPTNFIDPGQAFFVDADNTGNITFQNAQREHGAATFFKEKTALKDIKLRVTNLETSDQNSIAIVFDPNSTEGFDKLYDAPKWQGNPDLALYSLLGEQKLAIQSLPELEEPVSVKLGLNVGNTGNYQIIVTHIENFEPSTPITLEDKLTGNQVDLTVNPGYSFYISETGDINDRFILYFKSGVGIEDAKEVINPVVYIQNNLLVVKNLEDEKYDVKIMDITGRIISINNLEVSGFETGIYLVEITTKNNRFIEKVYIN